MNDEIACHITEAGIGVGFLIHYDTLKKHQCRGL